MKQLGGEDVVERWFKDFMKTSSSLGTHWRSLVTSCPEIVKQTTLQVDSVARDSVVEAKIEELRSYMKGWGTISHEKVDGLAGMNSKIRDKCPTLHELTSDALEAASSEDKDRPRQAVETCDSIFQIFATLDRLASHLRGK